MKKFLKYVIGSLAVLLLLLTGGFYAWTRASLAVPGPTALAALEADEAVSVTTEPFLTFRPSGLQPTVGFMLYPGANCDIRGYAAVLHQVAARGYLAVGVPMPLNLAVLAPWRADAVREAYPEVQRWVLAGHSMGGAMAASYAHAHQDLLTGLILWDSHPTETGSLAEAPFPVWLIHRATADGQPPEKFVKWRHLFPEDSIWTPIPGGNHMQFGNFIGGGYVEQWQATLGPEEQQQRVVEGTLAALATMGGPSP